MKFIYSIMLICFCISQNIAAQELLPPEGQEKIVRSGSIRSLDANGTLKYWQQATIDYDSYGRDTFQILWGWENEEWYRTESWKIRYNEQSLEDLEIKYRWLNEEWDPFERDSFYYNDDNSLAIQIESSMDEGEWLDYRTIEYEYNEHGNTTLKVAQYFANGEWGNQQKYIYEYDLNQNLILETLYKWNNDDWELDKRYTYTYDPDNQMIEKLYEAQISGEIYQLENYTYDYEEGRLTSMTTQLMGSEDWMLSEKIYYYYDEENINIRDEKFKYKDDQWVVFEKIFREYTRDGRILNIETHNLRNDEWYIAIFDEMFYDTLTVLGVEYEIASLYEQKAIWPNPVSNYFIIPLDLKIPSDVIIQLYSVEGRKISDIYNNFLPQGYNEIRIQRAGLHIKGGWYFLRINAGNKSEIKPIIFE